MRLEVQTKASGAPSATRVRRILERASALVTSATTRADRARSEAEISVLFCGDRRMRSLNRRYRHKDRSTDVLSFPAGAGGLLGDIAISIPYAGRQARRRGEPLAREVDRLLVHGYLHLLGYDHEVDDGEMDSLEARVRTRLGIAERPRAARWEAGDHA